MTIKGRIYGGMGSLVGLILLLGLLSSYYISNLAETFVEYRSSATGSLLVNDVAEDVFEARLATTSFRAKRDEKYVTELKDNLAEVREIESELVSLATGSAFEDQARAILPQIDAYEGFFLQGVELHSQRDVLVEDASAVGTRARSQLSDVMDSAFKDGDAIAAYLAGVATKSIVLGRLYFERFLVDNQPADFERAMTEFASAKSDLDRLLPELQNPERRALTEQTIADLEKLKTTASSVFEVITARNNAYAEMDRIGPSILTTTETIVDGIVDRQNTLGPAGVALAERTITIMLVTAVIGIVTGLALSYVIGRSITTPIVGITKRWKIWPTAILKSKSMASPNAMRLAKWRARLKCSARTQSAPRAWRRHAKTTRRRARKNKSWPKSANA